MRRILAVTAAAISMPGGPAALAVEMLSRAVFHRRFKDVQAELKAAGLAH